MGGDAGRSRCHRGAAPFLTEPGPIAGQGYTKTFEDNFDTLSSTWVELPWSNTGLGVTAENGSLVLRAAGDTPDHNTGEAVSTLGPRSETFPHYPAAKRWGPPTGEGGRYFEARMRWTNNPWTYVAFWLYGYGRANLFPNSDAWCPRLNPEWDILEGNIEADRQVETAVHKNTNGYCGVPDQQVLSSHPATPTTGLSDWHTWSGWWLPGGMVLYLDGQPLALYGNEGWLTEEMFLIFQVGASYGGPPPGDPPRPAEFRLEVDKLEVWEKP